jgi:hypothetical protein
VELSTFIILYFILVYKRFGQLPFRVHAELPTSDAFLIHLLFNDAVSSSHYIAPDGRMINELLIGYRLERKRSWSA